MTTISREQFVQNLQSSGLGALDEVRKSVELVAATGVNDGGELARRMTQAGALTEFQAEAVLEGNSEGLVIGNYVILDRLGAGGMGTVYKARHRRMKRVVAIKLLSRSTGQSPTFVQRFEREVEAIARLNHPNVVMAHDAGESPAGHFLVMEYVEGSDLAGTVQKMGPLGIREAVDCIGQAARALGYAHAQGLVHRDIKPANLLRDAHGVVKVADLGLARFNEVLGGEPEGATAVTQPGGVVGTVDYMSPEQALDSRNVDHRADIYSLGCALYFLLTGQPPYPGATVMAVLLKHRDAPVPSLSETRPGVPADLDAAFRRMVAKNPADRYTDMAAVVAALDQVAAALHRAGEQPQAVATPSLGATLELPAGSGLTEAAPTVLLVEPSRTQALIIRQYLSELGLRDVRVAASGQTALQALAESPRRLVVSALHLPDMTGADLAARLRPEGGTGPACVLISSQADAAGVPGSATLLHKPFGLWALSRALTAALGCAVPGGLQSSRTSVGEANVLVVDDSAAARAHMRAALSSLGLRHITEAADGVYAVSLLQTTAFDLIVTDYNMPRMDGLELLTYVRRRSPQRFVPAIMVTTETSAARLDPVRELGVAAVCEKSFQPEAVRKILDRLVKMP